jgi:hypothetical protein
MRPKIVIAVILAGFAGLLGIFFVKRLAVPPQPAPPVAASPIPVPVAPVVAPVASNKVPLNQPVPVAQVANIARIAADTNAAAEEHAAYVQARLDKLDELEANDDADSLHAILAELSNSDKEIRAAAVESTIQFGNRDAIPVLKDLATRTQDPDEKKALLDAADFLALPTMTEVMEQKRREKMQNETPPSDVPPAAGQP